MERRIRAVQRLAALIETCRTARGYLPPLRELAKRHGCCARTIRRDLEAMEAAGLRLPRWRWQDDERRIA